MRIFGALLAAGAAERFGAPKLLLPAGALDTVLSRAIATMLRAVDGEVLIVLPDRDDLHRALIDGLPPARLRPLRNARSAQGLGTSVAAAAAHALRSGADGLLLMPADLPMLPREHLAALVQAFRAERPWAAATEQAGPGTPAIFSRQALERLLTLQGARGAKAVLCDAGDAVLMREALPESLQDLDRWPAYAAAARTLGWAGEEPGPVAWQSDPPAVLPDAKRWRLGGGTQAVFAPGGGDGALRGWRSAEGDLLWTCGAPAAGLALLRAAALRALRGER